MVLLELSILSLNIWGIPIISKDRSVRVPAIAQELLRQDYDLISLQEVWSESDYQLIKEMLSIKLPFSHYFYSGVMGSGLCLFSKYPIISTLFYPWMLNGYVHRIQHGDWFGGKGVGFCRISVNDQIVNVYLAHLHAEYNREKDDYMTHRVTQAFDTAQFIESTRGDSVLQVLAGDLNTEKGDIAHRILLSTSKLRDPNGNIKKLPTNLWSQNTYTTEQEKQLNPNGIQIDYILYRSSEKFDCEVLFHYLPMTHKIPILNISYSDHEAITAKFRLKPAKIQKTLEQCDAGLESCIGTKEDHQLNLMEAIDLCNNTLRQLESHCKSYFFLAFGVMIVLFMVVDLEVPYGFSTAYLLLKFLMSGLALFFIFMCTLWNNMEKHATIASKLSMEVALARASAEET